MSKLFTKYNCGEIELANRVVMAPLTRCRAGEERVANLIMAQYYAQRASAGLIISEAVCISPSAVGYPETPGIWNEEQIAGWKLVTDAVHKQGGKIVAQLWFTGRISDPELLNGATPVSASAVKMSGQVNLLRPKRDFVTPRALEEGEIAKIINDYGQATINAKLAGFDGVELHAANGYLVEQFLSNNVNLRTDKYGGDIKNHSRLLLEIIDKIISVWSSGRVGVHLSPQGLSHDIMYHDPKALFTYLAQELQKRQVAFIFVREAVGSTAPLLPVIRQNFKGGIIANEGYKLDDANSVLENNLADAVSFGRDFISNADLVYRLEKSKPLNEIKMETIYGYGLADIAQGYIDYPKESSTN